MNTKDVNDIKAVNSDVIKVMSQNKVLWQKEESWISVKGPIFRSGKYDSPTYFSHQLNDYCPIRIIEFRLNTEANKWKDPFFIEFFGFYNKRGDYVSSKDSYDEKTQIFRMVFNEPVFKFDELYLKNVEHYVSDYSDEKATKVLDLQFRVIK